MNLVFHNSLSKKGINYYIDEKPTNKEYWNTYWRKFRYFYESPTIKMSFHFVRQQFNILRNNT